MRPKCVLIFAAIIVASTNALAQSPLANCSEQFIGGSTDNAPTILSSPPGEPFGTNRHLCYRGDGASFFAAEYWPEEFAPRWAAYRLSPGNYGPDQNHPEFSGKTFFPQSGSPRNSSHPTPGAPNLYGAVTRIPPGIDEIHLWEANAWAPTGYLHTPLGGTHPPDPPAGTPTAPTPGRSGPARSTTPRPRG